MDGNINTYVTQEGDMVDLIAFERFVKHGSEAALFEANPGLADYGPILPGGLIVKIPVIETPQTIPSKKLWG
jgi:phage tail protein X